ncbi:unannotated protein [freshwater metagenome]|uniref:Unannotated protein n=1 Tax=freshwater metagenome TaxID=449393 RepID=A0A6J7GN41_9ZZZZ
MRRPSTITLCGSTRFPDAFALANMHLSLQGHVVIGLGMSGHADEPRGARFLTSDGDESRPEKQGLDRLHFRKIDLSDAIYVVNVGGYIGSSTRREIAYAERSAKGVWWMFDDAIPAGFESWCACPDDPRAPAYICPNCVGKRERRDALAAFAPDLAATTPRAETKR